MVDDVILSYWPISLFCSTALTSAGWVRSTVLSSALSINTALSDNFFLHIKKSGAVIRLFLMSPIECFTLQREANHSYQFLCQVVLVSSQVFILSASGLCKKYYKLDPKQKRKLSRKRIRRWTHYLNLYEKCFILAYSPLLDLSWILQL